MNRKSYPLSDAEVAFARKVEAAGWARLSEACRALERGDTAKIAEWRERLRRLGINT